MAILSAVSCAVLEAVGRMEGETNQELDDYHEAKLIDGSSDSDDDETPVRVRYLKNNKLYLDVIRTSLAPISKDQHKKIMVEMITAMEEEEFQDIMQAVDETLKKRGGWVQDIITKRWNQPAPADDGDDSDY